MKKELEATLNEVRALIIRGESVPPHLAAQLVAAIDPPRLPTPSPAGIRANTEQHIARGHVGAAFLRRYGL